MNKLLYLLAASAVLVTAAQAADMPVKAANFSYPIDTSGWYLGIDTGAGVAQAKVSGTTNLFATSLVNGNLTAAGGVVGGCGGFVKGTAVTWWGLHSCVDYQNISASVPVDGANVNIASRWSASQEFRFGGNINPLTLLSNALPTLGLQGFTFPTFTPPSVNGGLNLAAAPHTYVALGVQEFGITGNFGQSGGASIGVAPMLKAGAIWQVLDGTGKATGGVLDSYAKVVFASKGFTMNNVFDPANNVNVAGSASVGNQYFAGLAYYFGVPTGR